MVCVRDATGTLAVHSPKAFRIIGSATNATLHEHDDGSVYAARPNGRERRAYYGSRGALLTPQATAPRARSEAEDDGRERPFDGGPVAELTGGVRAPALDPRVAPPSAGVRVPEGDLDAAAQSPH